MEFPKFGSSFLSFVFISCNYIALLTKRKLPVRGERGVADQEGGVTAPRALELDSLGVRKD